MIKITNLGFSYPKQQNSVFNDLNLEIEKGSFASVIGPNGCGKSTVIHMLNGLLRPTEGDIKVDGLSVMDKSLLWDIRKKINISFQNPNDQIVGNIVERDIAFGPENLGLSKKEIKKRIDESLNLTDLKEQRLMEPHDLSSGQKQKLALASILAIKPDVICLDEPSSMLDSHSKLEVMDILEKLNKDNNISIILTTHDLDIALKAQRIVLINKAKVIADFTRDDFSKYIDLISENDIYLPFWANLAQKILKDGISVEKFYDFGTFGRELCSKLRT